MQLVTDNTPFVTKIYLLHLHLLLLQIKIHIMNKTRYYYLDALRVFLTCIVFYHHSAIAFGASGGWYNKAAVTTTGLTQALLSASMGIDQSYFMSLFFFISALLMPLSFHRKGTKSFIMDRLNRLGIPLAIYFFILNPLLNYWIYGSWGGFGFGPMWFVFTLLLFELLYVVCQKLPNINIPKWNKPSTIGIISFMLISGTVAFLVRLIVPTGDSVLGLQLGYFPLYIGMYALGIVAQHNQWMDKINIKDSKPWFLLAILIGIPTMLITMGSCRDKMDNFSGGWNMQAVFYAFWEPIMCVGISYFLLVFNKEFCNKPNRIIQKMSANSFAFYFIHPYVVVGFTFLVGLFAIPPITGLAIVCILGIPVCFIIAMVIKKCFRFIGIKL